MHAVTLLIDAGNTRIKWALAAQDEWTGGGVLPLEQADELARLFAGTSGIEQVWVSNVAGPEIEKHVQRIDRTGRLHFILPQRKQCGVSNGYTDAAQLGSDRWAALIGAWQLMQRSCMVVNCGTAVTIDTLSAQGEFLGGLILPGVALMQRSLVHGAAQLQAEPGSYVAFPLNSADAIHSGAIQACCGAIERQYALLGDDSAPLILSGGGAGLLQDRIEITPTMVDNLVLHGLWHIAREAEAR